MTDRNVNAGAAARQPDTPVAHHPAPVADGDWRPSATLEMLRRRARLLREVRQFFDQREFLEVETPLLSRDIVVDRFLEPVRVDPFDGVPAGVDALWLQTSPEFAMKRLLAAGAGAIYQVSRAVRGGEQGQWHNPEFTMVEWYRVGDDYAAGRRLLAQFIECLLGRPPTRQVTFREAFAAATGQDPLRCPEVRLAELARMLPAPCAAPPPRGDRDALLQLLFHDLVQPTFAGPEAVIVRDWPVEQAALARVRVESPPVAERFELFVDGVELANGYHELTDAEELQRRNLSVNRQRLADGRPTLPAGGRLLEAMRAGLPNCCGVALGFDRLVMVATGAQSIGDVVSFDITRA